MPVMTVPRPRVPMAGDPPDPTVAPKTRTHQPRHDGLCIVQTAASGMKSCWCNCNKCWIPTGKTAPTNKGGNRSKGICACPDCPCDKRYVPRVSFK